MPPPAARPGSITAVLPTHDRVEALRANLDSVLALHGVDEVVVVDDGSTDGTAAWLGGLGDPRLRVLRSEVNRGSPTARNRGAAVARGEWVLFVEDDCRFPPDYAVVLRGAAERTGARIAGAPMVHLRGRDLATALAETRAERTGDGGLDAVAGFPERPVLTPLIPAPALVHRSVFDDVRFDASYRCNAYREETDFFLRALAAGHRSVLTPDTYFWEPRRYGGGQPRSLAAEWWTVRNNWRFLRRHRRWLVDGGHVRSPLREQLAFLRRRLAGLRPVARLGRLRPAAGR